MQKISGRSGKHVLVKTRGDIPCTLHRSFLTTERTTDKYEREEQVECEGQEGKERGRHCA